MKTKPHYIDSAAEAWYGTWISVEDLLDETRRRRCGFDREFHSARDIPQELIESNTNSPESVYLRKEALASLSQEAQELVELILNSPTEALEFLATLPPSHSYRSRRLGENWFGWTKGVSKQVDQEIRGFLKSMG